MLTLREVQRTIGSTKHVLSTVAKTRGLSASRIGQQVRKLIRLGLLHADVEVVVPHSYFGYVEHKRMLRNLSITEAGADALRRKDEEVARLLAGDGDAKAKLEAAIADVARLRSVIDMTEGWRSW